VFEVIVIYFYNISYDLILLVLEEYNYQNIYKAILKFIYKTFWIALYISKKHNQLFNKLSLFIFLTNSSHAFSTVNCFWCYTHNYT